MGTFLWWKFRETTESTVCLLRTSVQILDTHLYLIIRIILSVIFKPILICIEAQYLDYAAKIAEEAKLPEIEVRKNLVC